MSSSLTTGKVTNVSDMASTDWIDKNFKIIKCENINYNDVQINNITASIKHVSKVFLSLKGSAIALRERAAGNTSDLLV